MLITVYGLFAPPLDPHVRYVGITRAPLARRLNAHLSRARCGERTHKATWIRKVLAAGAAVQIKPFIEVPFEERVVWEQAFIAGLPNLTNLTIGGEGAYGNTYRRGAKHTSETRARMSAAHAGVKRSSHTVETKAKMRAARLGRVPSAETRARMSEAAKRKPAPSVETRQKLSAATTRQHVARRTGV